MRKLVRLFSLVARVNFLFFFTRTFVKLNVPHLDVAYMANRILHDEACLLLLEILKTIGVPCLTLPELIELVSLRTPLSKSRTYIHLDLRIYIYNVRREAQTDIFQRRTELQWVRLFRRFDSYLRHSIFSGSPFFNKTRPPLSILCRAKWRISSRVRCQHLDQVFIKRQNRFIYLNEWPEQR